MAADIKNYLKEKEKRQKSQDDYKKKIRKHQMCIRDSSTIPEIPPGRFFRCQGSGSYRDDIEESAASEPDRPCVPVYRNKKMCIRDRYIGELLFYLTLSVRLPQSQIHAGSLFLVDLHVDDLAQIHCWLNCYNLNIWIL